MAKTLGVILFLVSFVLSPVLAAQERWRTGSAYDLSSGELNLLINNIRF